MKYIFDFLSENIQFLMVNFSVYLNRRVFVMCMYAENHISSLIPFSDQVRRFSGSFFSLLIQQAGNEVPGQSAQIIDFTGYVHVVFYLIRRFLFSPLSVK